MDNTLLRKRGKKIPGVGWIHDPLGPKFRRNLVWGQRMLQFSTAVPATPAQLLRDQSILWETAAVHVAGKTHEHRHKTLCPVLWRVFGADRPLRVIAVEPVEYQLRIGQRERRQPAYLICTDPDLPVERILQVYCWRWDIEVNFRDRPGEKVERGKEPPPMNSSSNLGTNCEAFA